MATDEKKSPNNGRAVSPRNGQPVPRGRRFTPETAREAAKKSNEKQRQKRSITQAFLTLMAEQHTDSKGNKLYGNEIIANAILQYAARGNPKMVEYALALTGETPKATASTNEGQLADLIAGLKEPADEL